MTNLFPLIQNNERKHCHSVILSVYCSRVDAKAFGWASMIPLSHLSIAQDGQVKCRPKKKVIIKVSHSVVAEGTVWGAKAVRHDSNFCNFFLICFFMFMSYMSRVVLLNLLDSKVNPNC